MIKYNLPNRICYVLVCSPYIMGLVILKKVSEIIQYLTTTNAYKQTDFTSPPPSPLLGGCKPPETHCLVNKQGKSEEFDSCDRPSNLTQIGFKSSIFQPVWPWNLIDDLEKQYKRAPLLFSFKLYALFQSHWCIKTWVRVRKRPIWVKLDDF